MTDPKLFDFSATLEHETDNTEPLLICREHNYYRTCHDDPPYCVKCERLKKKSEFKTTPIRTMLKQFIALGTKGQNEIAKEIGLTNSSLSRFIAGKDMDCTGTLELIKWMFGHD